MNRYLTFSNVKSFSICKHKCKFCHISIRSDECIHLYQVLLCIWQPMCTNSDVYPVLYGQQLELFIRAAQQLTSDAALWKAARLAAIKGSVQKYFSRFHVAAALSNSHILSYSCWVAFYLVINAAHAQTYKLMTSIELTEGKAIILHD